MILKQSSHITKITAKITPNKYRIPDSKISKHEIIFGKSVPTIARQLFLERVTDWQDEGRHVKKLLLDYDKNYRKKICSKCTVEQQLKRKCKKLNMFTADGIQLKHCCHMDKARVKKFRETIRKHIQLHPAFKIV